MRTVSIPVNLQMKNELDKVKESDEDYSDVILRLIVDSENMESMLRYIIEKEKA